MAKKSAKVELANPKPPAEVFTVIHVTTFLGQEVRIIKEQAVKITETSVWIWNGFKERRVARITDYGSSRYFDARTEGKEAYLFAKKQLARWKERLAKQRENMSDITRQLKGFKERGFTVIERGFKVIDKG